ncbi:MAG: hypothetical protein RIQ81_2457 [Pseudomonadota bacterium]|jgi:hypothetical protein
MTSMAAENSGSSTAAALVTAWPEDWCHDWYVCNGDGQVQGPLAAEDVFAHPAPSARSVARRGFAQWYDEEDFAGLWKASRFLRALPVEVANPEPVAAPSSDPEFDLMSALAATGVSLSALAAPVAVTTDPVTALVEVPAIIPVARDAADAISPRVEQAAQTAPMNPRHVWLSQRANARLGDLRNPVLAAATVVMTFGVYYTAWLLTCLREVVWHIDHDTLVHRHVERPWLAWIPGGHFVVTWELARLIRSMEEQDGYTSTKPWLAAGFAVFPPLAAAYLQHALNDHWLIHCLGGCQNHHFPMQNELNTTSSTSSA